jgi:hypothetical protein
VGQRDEAEMGCGSGSVGAAARLRLRLIALRFAGLYQGTASAVPLGTDLDQARSKERRFRCTTRKAGSSTSHFADAKCFARNDRA